jgi:uncharacterized protein
LKLLRLIVGFLLLLAISMPFSVNAFDKNNMDEIQKSAEKGDPEAQTKLGVAYSTGTNVEKDKKKAAEWYGKAAAQGYAYGQWNLAFLYVRGEGVSVDNDKARELFQKAAEQKFAPAEYDLGMMHLYGMGGKRDRIEAMEWIRKAAEQGYPDAISFMQTQGEMKGKKVDKNKSSTGSSM